MKILIILDINLGSRICFKIGIYVLYTLLNNVCKFQKDWTSSSGQPAVCMCQVLYEIANSYLYIV